MGGDVSHFVIGEPTHAAGRGLVLVAGGQNEWIAVSDRYRMFHVCTP